MSMMKKKRRACSGIGGEASADDWIKDISV